MNWRFWRRTQTEEKESAVGHLIARQTLGMPVAPLERFDQFAKEGYAKNVVAFRCIKEISEAVASVPRVLFAGDQEADASHEVLQRLKRPNPMQSWATWIANVIGFYLIAGNSYMELVAPSSGIPQELYSLRPDRTSVVPGPRGLPQAYKYTVGTDTHVFEVDPLTGMSDLRHLKTFHPLDDWYGMSPIQAAATGINQFNISGEWNQSLLQRGASRRGGLELQASDGVYRVLDDIAYAKVNKRLEEQFTGPGNAGRPFFFEGGLKWVDMSFSPQDMDWINSKHTSARDICSAFGYPPMLLGIPGDNTYSNYKEARQALFENTVMPLVYMLLGELNVWFVPRFAEGLELRPDEDQVLALAPRRESLWDRVAAADFLSHNEKRLAIGYAPHNPTGDPADDLYQSATLLPLGIEVTDEDTSEAEGEFEKEMRVAGVHPAMIHEMKARLFGGNGHWKDDA